VELPSYQGTNKTKNLDEIIESQNAKINDQLISS
jgi:hypothetical protein